MDGADRPNIIMAVDILPCNQQIIEMVMLPESAVIELLTVPTRCDSSDLISKDGWFIVSHGAL